jgi:hypothetical protein
MEKENGLCLFVKGVTLVSTSDFWPDFEQTSSITEQADRNQKAIDFFHTTVLVTSGAKTGVRPERPTEHPETAASTSRLADERINFRGYYARPLGFADSKKNLLRDVNPFD